MAKLAKSSLCRWLEVSSTRLRLSLLMNVFGAMLEMLFSWSITYSKLSGKDRGTSFFILLWLASKVARLNSSCKLQYKHKISTYYSRMFKNQIHMFRKVFCVFSRSFLPVLAWKSISKTWKISPDPQNMILHIGIRSWLR